MKSLAVDLIFVLVVGLGFSLVSNAILPKGITIGTDYFHTEPDSTTTPPDLDQETKEQDQEAISITSSPEEHLRQKGLTPINLDQSKALFENEGYEFGDIIFVDARDRKHYEEGHIPGAYLFNHYWLEEFVEEVSLASEIAIQIVVYCNGGQCEDSEFAALDLIELGIEADKIHVFLGGIQDWRENKLPIELGPRLSGELEPTIP
jgi:rhodanese-related sulfurtransferase